jgi:hypothetical protein
MSQFFHGLHTHQTCHPLSMFGMLWIDIYQRVPVPNNIQQLRTAIDEEWDNIPQVTIKSLINSEEMCCSAWWSHQILTGFLIHVSPLLIFIYICDQQMHICIPSHVKSLDWSLMDLFQLTVFLI